MSNQVPHRSAHSSHRRRISPSERVSVPSASSGAADPAIPGAATGIQRCSRYGDARRSRGVGEEEAAQEADRAAHRDRQRDRPCAGERESRPVVLYAQLPVSGGVSLAEAVRLADQPEGGGVVRLLDPGEAEQGALRDFAEQRDRELRREHQRHVERAAQPGEREERAAELHEEAATADGVHRRGLLRLEQQERADGAGEPAGDAAVQGVPLLLAARGAGARGGDQLARGGAEEPGAGVPAVAHARHPDVLRGAAVPGDQGGAGRARRQVPRHHPQSPPDRAAAHRGVSGARAGDEAEQRARAGGDAQAEERHPHHHQAQGDGAAGDGHGAGALAQHAQPPGPRDGGAPGEHAQAAARPAGGGEHRQPPVAARAVLVPRARADDQEHDGGEGGARSVARCGRAGCAAPSRVQAADDASEGDDGRRAGAVALPRAVFARAADPAIPL